MIEKIESKIESFINAILDKETMTYCDYEILVSEINRLSHKLKVEKMDAEQEMRTEAMLAALTDFWK